MRFRRIEISNFMAFGDGPNVLDFDEISPDGGIVRVLGHKPNDHEASDNGSGKSTIGQAIYYLCTGEMLSRRSRRKVSKLARRGSKSMLITGYTTDDVKIQRGRNPNVFRIFVDPAGQFGPETEVDQAKSLQDWIVDRYGINPAIMRNTVIFDQTNCEPFLDCDAKGRREIVESLLGLEKWGKYLEETRSRIRVVKGRQTENEKALATARAVISSNDNAVAAAKRDASAWVASNAAAIASRKEELAKARSIDVEALLEAHRRWQSYDAEHGEYARKVNEIRQLNGSLSSMIGALDALSTSIKETKERAAELAKPVGQPAKTDVDHCPQCGQPMTGHARETHEKNVREAEERRAREMARLDEVIEQKKLQMEAARQPAEDLASKIRLLNETLGKEPDKPSVQRPSLDQAALGKVASAIESIEKRVAEMEAAVNPHDATVKRLEGEAVELHQKLAAAQEEEARIASTMSALRHWEAAFGDDGIRAYCVKSVIPQINERLDFWLDMLSDGRLSLVFDEVFEPTFKVEGRVSDVDLASNGEGMRIDVAIYLTFSDVMRATHRSNLDLLFMDEVGGNALDVPGKRGLFKAMQHLASDGRTILLITHDDKLGRLTAGGPRIVVENVDGVASLTSYPAD